jgi:hypothetical protein
MINTKAKINPRLSASTLGSKAYKDFKTGMDYYEVWSMLHGEQLAGTRRYVTRHTVLGKWHELKQSMFQAALDQYGIDEESLYG